MSVSTVSRVLNNRPDVSDTVRRRVLSVVENEGYIPNNSARDLVRAQSDSIGVVVRGMGNLFFSDLLKTISREIDRGGYNMVLRFIDSDADEVKTGAILEREKKLRGLLFLGGRYDYTPSELSLIGVPYVCCSYANSFGSLREDEYSSVTIDDHAAAYRAVEKLIRLGHRRIAILLPSCNDRSVSELRYNGYRAALRDYGLEFDSLLMAETGGCFEMPESYAGMCVIIDRGVDFSAVFTLSDTMAIAASRPGSPRGTSSTSAVLAVSEYVTPTLTTLIQPAEEMGRESVRILLDILDGHGQNRHLRLKASVREGGSVRQI